MAQRKPKMPAEVGSVGFKHNAGYVREEWYTPLQGARGIKEFRALGDNVSEVGSSLRVFRLVASQARWKFEPYSQAAEDIARAEFFDSLRGDMSHSWAALIRSALSMLQYGFAPHEVVFKRRSDGRIGWAKLPLRPQSTVDRWDIAPNGEVLGLFQRNASTNQVVKIPADKLLNFTIGGAAAGPEGVSILRSVFWDCFRLKRMAESEGIGIERAIAGLPVMRIPGSCMTPDAAAAQAAVFDQAKSMVQNIRTDEEAGIVLSSDTNASGGYLYSLELLSASGSTLPDTSKIIGGLRKSITQALSTDFMLLGHEGVGSYALGDSKLDIFESAIEGYLDVVAEEIQHNLVPLTLRLNGWPEDRAPRLKHLPLEKANLGQLGDYISKMVGSHVITPDAALEDAARGAADLPPRDPDGPPPPAPPAAPPPAPAGPPPAPATATTPAPAIHNEVVVQGLGKRAVRFMRNALGAIVGAEITEGEPAQSVPATTEVVDVTEVKAPEVDGAV